MKLYRTILVFCLFLSSCWLLVTDYCFAAERNIFGLHLTQLSDIDNAAKVINSSGGDWGYITIVIRLDQLDPRAWQDFFDKCRSYHLVPIIRLATIMDKDSWKQPTPSDIDHQVAFLNTLNWPTQSQHVILFNEINHASEWGGQLDIRSYTDIAIYAAHKLKSANPNFYILGSALDLAAPNQKNTHLTAADTYRQIHAYQPKYFDSIDALANHYYPQNSPRDYVWELNFIKSLGIKKNYSVYITETGWAHQEGEVKDYKYYTANTAAKLLASTMALWDKDARIITATPFIYNFPNPPFDHFSWLDKNNQLYPGYQILVDLPKNKNSPAQINSYQLIRNYLPFIILTDTEYHGQLILKNTGQTIWGETRFCLTPESTTNVTLETICTSNNLVPPGHSQTFDYKFTIKEDSNYKDKTFISWQNIPPLEITPLNGQGTIYSPKTTFFQKIIQYFQSWFI